MAELKGDNFSAEDPASAQKTRICTVHPAARNVGVVEPRVVVKISFAKIKSRSDKVKFCNLWSLILRRSQIYTIKKVKQGLIERKSPNLPALNPHQPKTNPTFNLNPEFS
jgi:hypothetical protein